MTRAKHAVAREATTADVQDAFLCAQAMSADSPTLALFGTLNDMFEFWNVHLYDGRLHRCVVRFRPLGHHIRGSYRPGPWKEGGAGVPEIALNENVLDQMSPLDIAVTLVRLMTVHWQYQTRRRPYEPNYRSQVWANQMKRLGLVPERIDKPGKQTGKPSKLRVRVVDGGPFDRAFSEMPFELPLTCGNLQSVRKPRAKFVCDNCGQSEWVSRSFDALCRKCLRPFVEEGEATPPLDLVELVRAALPQVATRAAYDAICELVAEAGERFECSDTAGTEVGGALTDRRN